MTTPVPGADNVDPDEYDEYDGEDD